MTNNHEAVHESTTGGRKGTKKARFDLIPTDALWQLAEHHGVGEVKYPTGEDGIPNFRRGYEISKSYAALQRHANQFWSGEDVDPETGSNHMIAAAWHALYIVQTLHDFGDMFDDRISTCRSKVLNETLDDMQKEEPTKARQFKVGDLVTVASHSAGTTANRAVGLFAARDYPLGASFAIGRLASHDGETFAARVDSVYIINVKNLVHEGDFVTPIIDEDVLHDVVVGGGLSGEEL